MIYHVMPVNDVKEHTEIGCECDPRVIVVENGNIVIVHNSFDGREGVEIANQILKPEN